MARSVRIKDHHAEQRLFESARDRGRRDHAGRARLGDRAAGVAAGRPVRLLRGPVAGQPHPIEPIPPNRGLILDRNGLPLATNAPSYQLELTREQVADIDATLRRPGAARAARQRRLPEPQEATFAAGAVFEAVPVKLQLTDEELARFAARRHQFPGVEIRPRLTRYYPLGASSVHAIGYVGAISEEDEKALDLNEYAGTTLTGKSGVEKAYERELHGQRRRPAVAGQRAGPQRRAHRQGRGQARSARSRSPATTCS